MAKLVTSGVQVPISIASRLQLLDRAPGLDQHDPRLSSDRTGAIGELAPAEDLIDDQHGQRQDEEARDSIGREGMGLPEVAYPLVCDI